MFHRCSCLNTNSRLSGVCMRIITIVFAGAAARENGARWITLASTMVSTYQESHNTFSVGKIPSESYL
jgi:hypothetical protein